LLVNSALSGLYQALLRQALTTSNPVGVIFGAAPTELESIIESRFL